MTNGESDEASEDALLSLVLENHGHLDSPKFASALFTGQKKELAKAFLRLRSKGVPITPDNVRLETKDEELTLLTSKLQSRKFAGSFELLVERLIEVKARFKIATVARKFYDRAYDEKDDCRVILSDFEKEVMEIRAARAGHLTSGSDYQETLDMIEWRNQNPDAIRGMSTGIPALDEVIDGIQPLFYLIGGRPSAGKTSIALDFCEAVMSAKGRVLFFSAETSASLIKQRMLSIVSGVPIGRIGRAHSPIERKRIKAAVEKLATFDWIIDETSSPSIAHIESATRQVHREKPISLVVGDYIQLFRGRGEGRKQSQRYEEVGEVSAGCKGIVKDLHVPVMMLAQLQRPDGMVFDRTEKKTITPRPQLHNLRESGNLENDADVAMLLYRNQEENSQKAELIVAKNKDGPLENINLAFIPQTYSFKQA